MERLSVRVRHHRATKDRHDASQDAARGVDADTGQHVAATLGRLPQFRVVGELLLVHVDAVAVEENRAIYAREVPL